MVRLRMVVALAVIVGAAAAAPVNAEPLEISWGDLIPQSAIIGDRVNTLQGIVQHSQVSNDPEAQATTVQSIEELLGITSTIEYRHDLEGTEVKILGYMIPLVMDGTKVTNFLLVPFVGACIHVPPPPANQLAIIDYESGYSNPALWDPVVVTGTLSVLGMSTDLAEVGYTITATSVQKI